MAVYTKLNKSQIKAILQNFDSLPSSDFKYSGVGMGTVNTYYKIVYSPKKIYFLKIDEVGDEKRLKNEINVFKNIKEQSHQLSYQTPYPLKTNSNKYYIPFKNKFVLIFPKVAGKAIFKALQQNHLTQIGQKMGELHLISLNKNIKAHRFCLKGLKQNYKNIQKKLIRKHPQIAKFIDKEFIFLNKNWPKDSSSCLVHADLFPENIHWKNKKFIGMIDFEAAGKGSPLFDLGVSFHALAHDGKQFSKSKIKAILRGYQKKIKLKAKDINMLRYFLRLTSLRFLITRLKDFELPQKSSSAENFKDYRVYLSRCQNINKFFI
ncbi:hypothetical protein BVY03_03950 [bacterium K02(2017)]|nr:hypothetical protein BVY03_03950 [bacterium K02(2017)]